MSRDGAGVDVAALAERVAALTHEVERVAWQFKVDPYPQRVRDLEVEVARLRGQLARQGKAIERLAWAYDPQEVSVEYGPMAYVFGIDDRAAVDAALDAPAPDPAPLIDGYTAAEWASVGVSDPSAVPWQVADAVRVLRADASTMRACGFGVAAKECDAAADGLDAACRALPPTLDAETRAQVAALIATGDFGVKRSGDGTWRAHAGVGLRSCDVGQYQSADETIGALHNLCLRMGTLP